MDKCKKCARPLMGNKREELCVNCVRGPSQFLPNCPMCGVKTVGCGRLLISAQDCQARHCRCPRNNIPVASGMPSSYPRASSYVPPAHPRRIKPIPKWNRDAATTRIQRDPNNAERSIVRNEFGKSTEKAQANGASAVEQKEYAADDHELELRPDESEEDDEDKENEGEPVLHHNKSSSSDEEQPPSPSVPQSPGAASLPRLAAGYYMS